MSGIIDDETLRSYVEESLEHLASIENDLLAIEEAGDDADEELINKVFRAAHSLKGGAGFLGLTVIKELAHKIENVLDLMRDKEISPTPEVVNILLLAFDRLRELINNVAGSNEEDVSEFLRSLTDVTRSGLPEDEKDSSQETVRIQGPDGGTALEIARLDLSLGAKGGKHIYFLSYDLIHDIQNKGRTPFDVLKTMMDAGVILESRVDIEAVGTLEDEPANRIPFHVLFASIIDPDIVTNIFPIPADRLFEVDQEGNLTRVSVQDRADIDLDSLEEAPRPGAAPDASPDAAPDASPDASPDAAPDAAPDAPQAEQAAALDLPGPVADQEFPDPGAAHDAPAPAGGLDEETVRPRGAQVGETSLRVHVNLLETLMNLAGELVLSRNQLMQAISTRDMHAVNYAGQRVDLVTSELQEAIMLTRMQPIGNIFAKFPRVVRDLSRELGKDIKLTMLGKEVELDKTIIEGLGDPLTHLVRNSVDHGVESPEARRKAGKPATGHITLKAFHEAGQVNIEIVDDGRGIDADKVAQAAVDKGLVTPEQVKAMSEKERRALIFSPGFSTAEQVTEVSGRGVGMDVVKTNLDRLGGQADIDSRPGLGTTIRIKLPLTLAIIPSLLLSVSDERFAIPQVNVEELLRIPPGQVKDRIEVVGDAQVLLLRGELIPIIRLTEVLGIRPTYIDPETGERRLCRRQRLADRRSQNRELFETEAEPVAEEAGEVEYDRRDASDRREAVDSDLSIVVVSTGTFKYGLVVEEMHDSVEIVVKPLGRHLKQCQGYAGATIMGDGLVALILDVVGLARMSELTSLSGSERAAELAEEAGMERYRDRQSFLVFFNGTDEQCAVPMDLVERVEQIEAGDIESRGDQKVMQYRGGSLPLFELGDVANVAELDGSGGLIVIVFVIAGREVGLLAAPPVDAVETEISVDSSTLKQQGVLGSAIIAQATTLIVDIHELVETLRPEWFAERAQAGDVAQAAGVSGQAKVLLVEDSEFFRNQVAKFIQGAGYEVASCGDGQEAWRYLQDNPDEVSIVVTDLEMPVMDGFELTRAVKGDERFAGLPVIAVTSLAGEEDQAKGRAAGVDDYQIKLDKDKLLASIASHLRGQGARQETGA
jgi:two-component system chemotaxis sensor kinase CheA